MLAQIDPPEPVGRYQRARPGKLIHLDMKKLGRFHQTGHRVTGTRTTGRSRDAGWDFVHITMDALSQHSENMAFERRDTTTGFLLRAALVAVPLHPGPSG